MQILARYSDIGRYSKVEAQAHYHQEGITMWITWYMAKFAREFRYQEIEVEYYDFNWKKQRQKLSGRSVSMKLIICPERLYNMDGNRCVTELCTILDREYGISTDRKM